MNDLDRCYRLLRLESGASLKEVNQAYGDVLVTATGQEILMAGVPKLVKDLEASLDVAALNVVFLPKNLGKFSYLQQNTLALKS